MNGNLGSLKYLRLISLVLLVLIFKNTHSQDAKEIVRRADEKLKGKTSSAEMIIQIVRPAWTREMTLKTWSKGNDLALIRVLSPAKEKGIVFLKRNKEVWNWIPSIERNIKLPPSMMSQSWMGTDFTNDDLVKEASIAEDYVHTILNEEVVNERLCYKIQMIPKPEASVVWGKVFLWVDKKDLLIMKSEYYDEGGSLINTMISSDIRNLGGKLLPSRMEMIPADKKGNKTVLIYNNLIFDKEISDDFFSTRNMQILK
jgi:outer membrane lipoprotein-sorting protein